MPETEEQSATTTRVSLTNDAFNQALEHYIDENKPDPLALKQVQSWTLEWKDDDDGESFNDYPFAPSHVLEGNLQIGGEYLAVTLSVRCAWKLAESPPGKHGSLYYSCHAQARFWTKSEITKRKSSASSNDNDDSAKNDKTQDKIRTKMIARLREDSYISKHLLLPQKDGKPRSALLAQANIKVDATDLEERVHVSDDVSEAIKRAVWSSAETPLDVIELVLNLPCLPTSSSNDKSHMTTPLANRAKLRLLEDAMVDACEKEGEDDLIEELKISEKTKEEEPESSNDPQKAPPKHNDKQPTKSSKKMRSN
jgi:hypothetical protein